LGLVSLPLSPGKVIKRALLNFSDFGRIDGDPSERARPIFRGHRATQKRRRRFKVRVDNLESRRNVADDDNDGENVPQDENLNGELISCRKRNLKTQF
jgi:hypothetical protein